MDSDTESPKHKTKNGQQTKSSPKDSPIKAETEARTDTGVIPVPPEPESKVTAGDSPDTRGSFPTEVQVTQESPREGHVMDTGAIGASEDQVEPGSP